MNVYKGTYGASQNSCEVIAMHARTGETWYCVEGSTNVNCTFDDVRDGVDVETLADCDSFTASFPIYDTDDLEKAIDE